MTLDELTAIINYDGRTPQVGKPILRMLEEHERRLDLLEGQLRAKPSHTQPSANNGAM